ncbi:MAG: UDP-2,3-diacylglucosamine diphosphatase [Chitinophagales bacterium]|nr:UDP-2,3-diacylglucosamine diphosphatase [Chitinophagales bacterium]MCO5281479.1 UDP-2,3-diacylglucosamine diphosphatase [Chitinophagales bacterium]OJV27734.1 MAG: UDP-2,3-diacylglucosamine hydrolase [Bacteroidetes bacterium 37-13]HRN93434.1 UDP-2,3-diacylglucosamine diphosphatase [Chitinophagales bacterium]HRP38506.1 UDP-2,3-diacylglucosamine diphosphatase [Chitinophagales bacterium]
MRIYFASDLHLGTPDFASSKQREAVFIQWLKTVAVDADEIFLVGDIFDFWHEYETVVPKGFVRLQGKIAALCDSGIPVHIFTGNHDLWMHGYLERELGATVHYKPIEREWNGKKFFIGHGDGLGPDDKGYKRMKKLFTNPLAQFAFRWLHPDIGMKLGSYFSKKSRFGNGEIAEEKFLGEAREWLVQYCKRKLTNAHFDYFIFGHRHLPLQIQLNEKSTYINLGDWIHHNSYAVFDGDKTELKFFKP